MFLLAASYGTFALFLDALGWTAAMIEGHIEAAGTPNLLPAGGDQSGATAAAVMLPPTGLPVLLPTGSLATDGLAVKSAVLAMQSAQLILMMLTCLLTR